MIPGTPYLLVVDDDREDFDLFAEGFRRQNPSIAVKYLPDGIELMSYLHRCKPQDFPSVLLLDYYMPGMNVLEILQRIQAGFGHLPIMKIVWSTSRRDKDMEDCRNLGASYYLVKPSTDSELRHVIHQVGLLFDLAAAK